MIGQWTFDYLVGTDTLPDASGNDLNASVSGSPRIAAGKLQNSLFLRGASGRVDLGDLGITTPATVMFWFYTCELVNERVILSQRSGNEAQAGALFFDGIALRVWDGADWHDLDLVDEGLRYDTWQHIAVVYGAGGDAIGFLNGVRQRTVRCSFDFDGVVATVGGKFLCKRGHPFISRLDDLRVYSVRMTANEILLCSGFTASTAAERR